MDIYAAEAPATAWKVPRATSSTIIIVVTADYRSTKS
jgi:hypothetical protein